MNKDKYEKIANFAKATMRHADAEGWSSADIVRQLAVLSLEAAEENLARIKRLEEREKNPPSQKCGTCGGKLIWERGHYIHAEPMFERHGAWAVEDWEEE